jgi:hypothetical protein
MRPRYKLAGGITLLLFIGLLFPSHSKTKPIGENGMQFEYLGCTEDWPEHLEIETIITKEKSAEISYFVRTPATCGLDVNSPNYNIVGNTLELSYHYYAPGALAACLCEFQSRFTFKSLPINIKEVKFHSS